MEDTYLFTSESVARGHPDKVADQISDAVLDACLLRDPLAKVACETLVTKGLVFLAGEVTTTGHPDYEEVVRKTVKEIGYDRSELGFDYQSCGVINAIHKQSPDIALGVDPNTNHYHQLGAGDQGVMFGYACNETEEYMPLPIVLAHRITTNLSMMREQGILGYLRPDAKTQVTIEYDAHKHPCRLHTVVLSVQHEETVAQEKIRHDMIEMIHGLVPPDFIDPRTVFYINPTGRFVIGGPAGDTGLTGRKIIIDTYGGMCRHGGGAFSGKDPTKVDRSASYAARYAAKHVVAAHLAERCEVQVSYGIGLPFPLSLNVNTFGTGVVHHTKIAELLMKLFDFTPEGIIDMLKLRRPIYAKTAFGGHFGRAEPGFTWEKLDRLQDVKNAIDHL